MPPSVTAGGEQVAGEHDVSPIEATNKRSPSLLPTVGYSNTRSNGSLRLVSDEARTEELGDGQFHSSSPQWPSTTDPPRQPNRHQVVVSFPRDYRSMLYSPHSKRHVCSPDNKPTRNVEGYITSNDRACPFRFICRRNASVFPPRWWEASLIGGTNKCLGACERVTVGLFQLKKKKKNGRFIDGAGPVLSEEAEYKAHRTTVTVGFVCLAAVS